MMRILLTLLLFSVPLAAQDQPAQNFLKFIQSQAKSLRAADVPPDSLQAWQTQRQKLRDELLASWGGFPTNPAPLEPTVHGVLKRDGYRVEKITFQTLPGVRMTANAYVPAQPGKRPAVLCVHGHWRGAKQDPAVQARCIGLVKLGFFVLCVDAFGAGERAIGTALGEYHGEMVGAALLTIGKPLSGIQVYENRRAVDYLLTRSEVDGEKLGITGASGGGNQTMYAGAMDERLKCVVPVCSVGNYQAYLGAACCLCEVVPGALRFTEEAGLLSLVAPRGLMVINATQDSFQFSVGEAKKSIAAATPVFQLYGKPNNIRHTIFESKHDYSKPMREAMYGWMTLHLLGRGDGSPIPEPLMQTEKPEELRCYPGDSRPKDWLTIPRFVKREGEQLVAAKPWPTDPSQRRETLVQQVFGGFPKAGPLALTATAGPRHSFEPEPGVLAHLNFDVKTLTNQPTLLISFVGAEKTRESSLYQELVKLGRPVVILEPRASGPTAVTPERVGRAPDHNSAEWSLWLGRPLLGQWTLDVLRGLDALEGKLQQPLKDVRIVGEGPAAMVALTATLLDHRLTQVAAVGMLSSFLSDEPIVGQRLGLLAPKIVPLVGDIPQLVELTAASKRVLLVGPVQGSGQPADGKGFSSLEPSKLFRVVPMMEPSSWLPRWK